MDNTIGSPFFDQGFGIAANANGSIVVAGRTLVDLAGPTFGGFDAFLVSLHSVPEPSTLLLILSPGIFILTRRANGQD
jgi:hypothetical protein